MSSYATPIQQASGQGPAPPPRYQVRRPAGTQAEEDVLAVWQRRLKEARADRRRYEPDWYLCQAYVANKQWVGWSKERNGRVVSLLDDPKEANREHHTENVLTAYVRTALGQMISDDLMPTLFFRREDVASEKYTEEANFAYRYAFDEELDGDDVLNDVFLNAIVLGTGATQCRYLRGRGPSYGEFPVGPDGQPITDMQAARDYVAQAQQQGQRVQFQELRGELEWRPLNPFNLLVPPGVPRMRDMPWLIVSIAVPVEQLKAEFPSRAQEIKTADLQAIDMIGLRELPSDDPASSGGGRNKLSGHALLSTGYEQPTLDFPDGRVINWSGETLLEESPRLPYRVGGRRVAGVVPFRYGRVPGRFWGLGLVEPALGVQRQRNRARSQHIEWKDRNLGRVYATKGTITQINVPRGKIMELIEVAPGYQFPQETQPGTLPNVEQEVQMLDDAMDRVTGISRVSAGSSGPPGVSAYSAFALLKEQDQERNKITAQDFLRGIRDLTKVTLDGIKQYWPPQKLVLLKDPDGPGLADLIFNASKLPALVYVQVGKGAGTPATPAAQVQLCFDLYDRSISGGQPLPIQWLKQSLEAGKPMPLPLDLGEVQKDKAEYENMLMAQGQLPTVAPYDDDQLHIQTHRSEQTIRQLDPSPEGQMVVQVIEQHIGEHQQSAEQKAMATATPNLQGPMGAMGGATSPGAPAPPGPGLPPGAGQPGPALPAGLPSPAQLGAG